MAVFPIMLVFVSSSALLCKLFLYHVNYCYY